MADKNLRIRTLLSIIALPGVVLVVIPAIILWLTGSFNLGWGLQRWLADQFGEDYQVYKQNVPR